MQKLFVHQDADPSPQRRHHLQILALSAVVLGSFLLIWVGSTAQRFQTPDSVQIRTDDIVRGGLNMMGSMCMSVCQEKNKLYDLLDRQQLLQHATDAKLRLLEKLRVDYGAVHFQRMFVDGDTYRPFTHIDPSGVSMTRLKRKLLIKVLSVQQKFKKQDYNADGTCNCNDKFETYVWATGGHSSAAGHGNLFNETYTAFLERDLKDIFGSIGIEFIGRNYAMGGTSSSGEIAMCWEQIFGVDVDFFTWDYGMTDGNHAEKMLHYGYRGGSSPGFPAFLGITTGSRARKGREAKVNELEAMGMAGFFPNEESWIAVRDAIPNSSNLTQSEAEAMPEYVKNLKCSGIEKGSPFCDREKYTTYACPQRKKQTSWHPGFKEHARRGHSLALFLVQALLAALKDLNENQNKDIDELLLQFQKEEEELKANFSKADLPKDYKKAFKVDEKFVRDFDVSLFFKGRSLCHTGRLPSQTRYLGYLTNTQKVGGPGVVGNETYDVGVNDKEVIANPTNGSMRLAWEARDRERCPAVIKPDYKDFFMTTDKVGWAKLSFPNDAEKTAYNYVPSQFKGVIVLVFRSCDWGKCEKGFLDEEDYQKKRWEMKVNSEPVIEIGDIGAGAMLLKGKDGIYFTPNEEGAYDFEIKVNEPNSFVKLSSFIIF